MNSVTVPPRPHEFKKVVNRAPEGTGARVFLPVLEERTDRNVRSPVLRLVVSLYDYDYDAKTSLQPAHPGD